MRKIIPVLTAAILMALATVTMNPFIDAALAETVIACINNKSGKVKLRTGACKNFETQGSIGADTSDLADKLSALEGALGEVGTRVVFTTKDAFNGDLQTAGGGIDGLDGGDNLCQDAADDAAAIVPIGIYKFWGSTAAVDAKDRIDLTSGAYFRSDGVKVADSSVDLLDGTIDAPITFDEGGIVFPLTVWTSTKTDGTLADVTKTCNDWTSGSVTVFGREGENFASNFRWTDNTNSSSCNGPHRIYCFQVLASD